MNNLSNPPVSPLIAVGSRLPDDDQTLVRTLIRAEEELIRGLPSDSARDPKRRKRVGATATEIEDQPQCIAKTLAGNADTIDAVAARLAASNPTRLVLTGCGDSLACHIGMRLYWEQATGLPCLAVQALDLAYYPGAYVDDRTIVLALSSSGSTPRTVEALLNARENGATTIALTNTPTSPIADMADATVLISAKRVGWPTQASTAAMAAEAQIAEALGKALGREPMPDALAPARMEGFVADALAATRETATAVGKALSGAPLVHLCGGGPAMACAMFGAAKIKECTSGHAIAHPLEEVHHYTSTKPGETMIVIAPDGPSRARALETLRQVRAWGGKTVGIIAQGDDALAAECDSAIFVPQTPEIFVAQSFTIPLHYIALAMAMGEFERADNG
ncbi:SIS domain-containing protein [Jannaschia sp. 2305UL9-9]|uniref:SIS domain-containing protein n=1 Tax=Jannaschia sp. 2305UL9-9 TaxID=3121638 RepID=UPI00352742CA